MFPATTCTTDQSASSTAQPTSDSSALLSAAFSKAFQRYVMTLSGMNECSLTIQEMLKFINDHFPREMLNFQKSLEDRELTVAENSCETKAVTIHPMGKLLDKYECFELPENLNSLVKDFNFKLNHFKNNLQDSENPSELRKMNLLMFSTRLYDFGKDILKKTNCLISRADKKNAEEIQWNLNTWHNSVKILSEGVLDPLLDETEGLNQNSIEKDNAISLLDEIQKLLQKHGKKDYYKIDILLRSLANGMFRETARSRLSGYILTDFIGSGDLVVFQKTMQLLFDYYQFTPYDGPLGEIGTDLCDTIKMYAAMKKPTGFFF
ncbi:hypothetical protein J7438_02785 [Thalassotalea sp. G20_0]|uniref:hypothetical protein n=1 Tax=Thalassotalea sp. G20_0 TaxID=2821093 RepID=UPI001AD973C8|nr:hypothetical protein [Thalassotalea sp. G20_0]MBO9493018.1 hypothetical protein [Thalassotalea sp. G20_0]